MNAITYFFIDFNPDIKLYYIFTYELLSTANYLTANALNYWLTAIKQIYLS